MIDKIINRLFGVVDRNNKKLKVGDYVVIDENCFHLSLTPTFEEYNLFLILEIHNNGDLCIKKYNAPDDEHHWRPAKNFNKIDKDDALIKLLKGELK
jgi:hypothetical protein